MTTTTSSSEPAPTWQTPRLDSPSRLVGGLASGIAAELGIDVLWVRGAFVALFAVGGWGAVLYFVGWGVAAALEYDGRTDPGPPSVKGRTERSRLLGFVLVVLGVATLCSRFAILAPDVVWPAAVFGFGALLAKRQIAPGSIGRATGTTGLVQAIAGFVLMAVGLGFFVHTNAGEGSALGVTVAVLVLALVLVVVSSPWWWQMVQSLDKERQARARSEERAEVAAHLHDSVLQTLTLIQKNDDPEAMIRLARRQERELRNWLDPARASRRGASVRGRLDEMASEAEELFGVSVETVVVGDCLIDEGIDAALAAAREAVTNAAKHAGVERIDVYAEVSNDAVELFVRDQGRGFDPATVASDRRGVRESIEGRMARAGGEALIVTEPGEGTEVEIRVGRADSESQESP